MNNKIIMYYINIMTRASRVNIICIVHLFYFTIIEVVTFKNQKNIFNLIFMSYINNSIPNLPISFMDITGISGY